MDINNNQQNTQQPQDQLDQNAAQSNVNASGTTTPNRQQKGTGFTNIQNILGANQGAGQNLANSIGSGLNNQADSVRQGIQQSQQNFQTGYNQSVGSANNTINTGNTLLGYLNPQNNQAPAQQSNANAAGSTSSSTTPQSNVNGNVVEGQTLNAGPDYSGLVNYSNQNNLSQSGQNLQNLAYNGPAGLNNSQQLLAKAANAAALGSLTGSASGQQQLLQNYAANNKNNYTSGESSLDQLLLGQQGQQTLQNAAQNVSGLGNLTKGAITSAQQQANSATNNINSQKANTISALQSALGDTGNGTTGILGQAQQQGQQFNSDVTRLQQLMSGVDANGNKITASSITPSDQALLNNMSQFGGLPTSSIYTGGTNAPSSYQNALKAISQSIGSQSPNGYYFNQPDQQKAALALSQFLGDQTAQNTIANNQFSTQVINPNQNDYINSQITAAKNPLDQQTQQSIANNVNPLQDAYGNAGNQGIIYAMENGATPDQLKNFTMQSGAGLSGNYNPYNSNDISSVQSLFNNFQNATGVNPFTSSHIDTSTANPQDAQAQFANLIQNGINGANQMEQNTINQNSSTLQQAILKQLAANGS